MDSGQIVVQGSPDRNSRYFAVVPAKGIFDARKHRIRRNALQNVDSRPPAASGPLTWRLGFRCDENPLATIAL